jgi:hemolysin activation/secretion protein
VRAAQFYVYGDVGTVGNEDEGFGGGTLASVGGGVRLSTAKVSGSLELGVPLKDAPFASSNRDVRASFTLSARF